MQTLKTSQHNLFNPLVVHTPVHTLAKLSVVQSFQRYNNIIISPEFKALLLCELIMNMHVSAEDSESMLIHDLFSGEAQALNHYLKTKCDQIHIGNQISVS